MASGSQATPLDCRRVLRIKATKKGGLNADTADVSKTTTKRATIGTRGETHTHTHAKDTSPKKEIEKRTKGKGKDETEL